MGRTPYRLPETVRASLERAFADATDDRVATLVAADASHGDADRELQGPAETRAATYWSPPDMAESA